MNDVWLASVLVVGSVSCASPANHGAEDPPVTSATVAPTSKPSETPSAPAPSSSHAAAEEPGPLTVPDGALFAYREGDVSVAFTPPRRVTLLGGSGKPCSYELPDNGNMYSGAEVEHAWQDAEVQSAISQSKAFMSPDDLSVTSEVRGAKGRIAWTPFCGGLCVSGPPGVTALLRVLHVVVVNVRGVCKT